MGRVLTVWVTPFTTVRSLNDAIGIARGLAASVSSADYPWTARLLLPTHFGRWPQAECRQSLPADMRVASPADVGPIRHAVNSKGLLFGTWGVPVDQAGASVAAGFAAASPCYVANFEPSEFWLAGDDPYAIDTWYGAFWNALPDPSALDGKVMATVVPNQWGLSAFSRSLPNLVAGCNGLALETYGGGATQATYPRPNCWPTESFYEVHATGTSAPLVAILARANLHSQIGLAAGLSHSLDGGRWRPGGDSNVHVWAI